MRLWPLHVVVQQKLTPHCNNLAIKKKKKKQFEVQMMSLVSSREMSYSLTNISTLLEARRKRLIVTGKNNNYGYYVESTH